MKIKLISTIAVAESVDTYLFWHQHVFQKATYNFLKGNIIFRH